MKKFNINDQIYIQITEDGWDHLKDTYDDGYIQHCIKPYSVIINGVEWYRLQCHSVFELFPINFGRPLRFMSNILIDEINLNDTEIK
jgi:hypothetical protein